MNANNEKCLGENSYKRNYGWERKRRIVVNEEASTEKPKHIDFSDGSYPNLPIAPGLPDIIPRAYELEGRLTRSTCADVMNYRKEYGEVANISFDLSKYREKKVLDEAEKEEDDDDGLSGFPDSHFTYFESRRYIADLLMKATTTIGVVSLAVVLVCL